MAMRSRVAVAAVVVVDGVDNVTKQTGLTANGASGLKIINHFIGWKLLSRVGYFFRVRSILFLLHLMIETNFRGRGKTVAVLVSVSTHRCSDLSRSSTVLVTLQLATVSNVGNSENKKARCERTKKWCFFVHQIVQIDSIFNFEFLVGLK
jgi:hypothetical protein